MTMMSMKRILYSRTRSKLIHCNVSSHFGGYQQSIERILYPETVSIHPNLWYNDHCISENCRHYSIVYCQKRHYSIILQFSQFYSLFLSSMSYYFPLITFFLCNIRILIEHHFHFSWPTLSIRSTFIDLACLQSLIFVFVIFEKYSLIISLNC